MAARPNNRLRKIVLVVANTTFFSVYRYVILDKRNTVSMDLAFMLYSYASPFLYFSSRIELLWSDHIPHIFAF